MKKINKYTGFPVSSLRIIQFLIVASAILFSGCLKTQEAKNNSDQNITPVATALVVKAFSETELPYVIVVNKSCFTLAVVNRNLEEIAHYTVAIGANTDGQAKRWAGDRRTPEGIYRIVEMLSMDAPKESNSYKKLSRMNSVYFSAGHGHFRWGKPNEDLGSGVYGGRFFRLNYPNDDDKKRYAQDLKDKLVPLNNGTPNGIGSGIAIHGNNDPDSIGHFASGGCIRMDNDDVVNLQTFIQIGTPVVIFRSEGESMKAEK